MFKVYGITYTFTTNYGTCLQAYALQKTIEDMTINGEKPEYSLIPISKCPEYFSGKGGVKGVIKYHINSYTRKQFLTFEKRMKYAEIKPLSRFSEYNTMADAFVCGSDVIWNPKFNHGVSAFYLDFARKYAFSYAASFGQSDIDSKTLQTVSGYIKKLNAVSVREKKSAEIAQLCTSKQISTVVDPVLLLSRQEWSEIAKSNNPYGKYIFVYTVNSTALLKQFVKKLKKQTGLRVIYSGGNAGAVLKQGIMKSFTPESWLQLIRDAEFVVTDSFHGTAFSVLNQKVLFTIVDGDPNNGFNMRMGNFLKELGLNQCICTTVPDRIDCTLPDYTKVESLINERISKSKMFLQENLEAAYKEKQNQGMM